MHIKKEELGKYIWLTEADTSQEAHTSKSGSSSHDKIRKIFLAKKYVPKNLILK